MCVQWDILCSVKSNVGHEISVVTLGFVLWRVFISDVC